jgi:pimeloyl-ACP methyl ester carboxylesterase
VGEDSELQPLMRATQGKIRSVVERLGRGDVEGGARQFVEEVALGRGAWAQLPAAIRETMVRTAPAIVAEQRDPYWAHIDPSDVARLSIPLLLTRGDKSPPWFSGIVARLARIVGHAKVRTFAGAGHAPHITHPDDYVAALATEIP